MYCSTTSLILEISRMTDITRIQRTIDFAWENPHSDFYRAFWRKAGITEKPQIDTPDELAQLPSLSRDDLAAVPHPSDRVFRPLGDVEMLRSTSGTSGRGALYFWRDRFDPDPHTLVVRAGARRAMIFFVYHNCMSAMLAAREVGLQEVCGDPHNVPQSVAALVTASCDAIITSPSVALLIADELDCHDYAPKITHVLLFAEFCSDETVAELKRRYPNASFSFNYALAELGDTVGYATHACSSGNQFFHINTKDVYPEHIDSELMVTSVRIPHAMPLIRYRTGDQIEWDSAPCACGDTNPRFKLRGRIGGDFVRVAGGEIRVDMIDRALADFIPYLEPFFRVRVAEYIRNGKSVAHLEMQLVLRTGFSGDHAYLRAQINSALRSKLYLSATRRLRDAIAAGSFVEPTVTFLSARPPGHKNKQIVRDV